MKKNKYMLSVVCALSCIMTLSPITTVSQEVDAHVASSSTSIKTVSKTYGVNAALYLKESYDKWSWGDIDASEWSEPLTDSQYISEDGEYTFSLTGLNIPSANLCLCYIKDSDVYNSKKSLSFLPSTISITTESVKANGQSLDIADGVRTSLYDGVFDVAYHNEWNNDDNVVDFTTLDTITSVEVTIKVDGLSGQTPDSSDITAPKATSIKSAALKNKTLTVKLKKVSAATGYQVQVSYKKNMSSPVKKNISATSSKIKLKKNKTCYVRVRSYKTNSYKDKLYSSWSSVKKVNAK